MYEDIIESAAKEYSIDPKLIRAFITVESSWNPTASRPEPRINDASWGLMQVLLATGRRVSNNPNLTSEQLVQPTANILIGTKFIRELWDRYKGNLTDVIAAYNAGSAFRSKSDPTKYTNQQYVDKVMRVYKGPSTAEMGFSTLGVLVLMGLALLGKKG